MKRLPIAKTELSEIVKEDCLYVDKTHYVKQLFDEGHKYYFLSRPRRFGKSLFVDTLRAAFSGEKELFKGLYLENNWDWSVNYPVIKISFGRAGVKTAKELNIFLQNLVTHIAKKNSLDIEGTLVYERFYSLIEQLCHEKGEVVVLIDEYDKPLLDNLTKNTVEEIREELSSFYAVLKDASASLKFVFLTGVSRFSRTSIFSRLNNLTDISLVPKYGDICGISQADLEKVFVTYLKDVDLQKVKQWYDGYNFLGSQLYNPYDLLMFLWDKRYRCYWFETGTPSFLLELIKKKQFYVPDLENTEIMENQLAEFEISNIQLEVLLFQSGYLSIKNRYEYDENYIYALSFPNKEVKKGFNDYLLRFFYAAMVGTNERTSLSKNIYLALAGKEPKKLETAFHALFSGVSHEWYKNNNISSYEGFYCSMFYMFFAALGLEIKAEDTTNKGRIDFTVVAKDTVFIFEVKMKHIGQNALAQIKERRYHEKYQTGQNEIFMIGVEFDEEARNISAFEWEKYIAK